MHCVLFDVHSRQYCFVDHLVLIKLPIFIKFTVACWSHSHLLKPKGKRERSNSSWEDTLWLSKASSTCPPVARCEPKNNSMCWSMQSSFSGKFRSERRFSSRVWCALVWTYRFYQNIQLLDLWQMLEKTRGAQIGIDNVIDDSYIAFSIAQNHYEIWPICSSQISLGSCS